ncbi:MAG: hypothetical protein AAGA56_14635, partial [Myxococcota bacterium]
MKRLFNTGFYTTVIAFALSSALACKSNYAAVDKTQQSATATIAAATVAKDEAAGDTALEDTSEASADERPAKEGNFGAIVGDADRVSIRVLRVDGKLAAGDKPLMMDKAWLKKLLTAV